jgi:hypothetical protein
MIESLWNGATEIVRHSSQQSRSAQGSIKEDQQSQELDNWAAGYYGLHNVDKTKWIEL